MVSSGAGPGGSEQQTLSTDTSHLGGVASKGVGVTLVSQVVKIGVQVVGLVVLSRLLSPEDFGLVAIVTALIGIAEIFRDFGLTAAAIQAKTLSTHERTNLFWVNVAIGGLCSLAAICVAPLISNVYDDPRLLVVVLALAPVFLINGASAQYVAGLSRDLRFKSLAIAIVGSQAIGVFLAIVVAATGAGYWALILQQGSTAISLFVIAALAARWLPGLPDRSVSVRRFVRFGSATVGSKTLSYVAKNVDVAALGLTVTRSSLGSYTRAYELVSAPLDQINTPLTRVALPILAKVADQRERFERYVQKSQLVACYLTTTALAVAAGIADPLVELALGPQWSNVAGIFVILAVGGAFRSMAQVTYWTYLAKGLVGPQLQLYAATQSIIIVFILAGLPWGVYGVASGGSLGYLVFWLAGLWHIHRVADVDAVPLFRRSVMVIIGLAIPAGVIARLATSLVDSTWGSALLGALAGGLYLLLAAIAVPAFRQDLAFMIRFARRGLGS
jgi:O-antigen/teichoic acid export membrane protein